MSQLVPEAFGLQSWPLGQSAVVQQSVLPELGAPQYAVRSDSGGKTLLMVS